MFTNRAAFDVSGGSACSGSPLTCEPLWTMEGLSGDRVASPTVAEGSVFVMPRPQSYQESYVDQQLALYDANGVVNCGGAPKTCQPMWRAVRGEYASPGNDFIGNWTEPTVAGGVMYVTELVIPGRLLAFDAHGVTNCGGTPKLCTPLWASSAELGPGGHRLISNTPPPVVDGVVYAQSISAPDGAVEGVYAFDAAGTTGCGGTPKVCQPLWRASLGTPDNVSGQASLPVVNGVVYAADDDDLAAFDASGAGPECTSAPITCQPLWTGARSEASNTWFGATAVAGGRVFVPVDSGVEVFDAAGTEGCAGEPVTCVPVALLDTGPPATYQSNPGVTAANGLAFVGGDGGIWAFDAALSSGCSGSPLVCHPLWHSLDGQQTSVPAVVNGKVHVISDGMLVVFGFR